MSRAPRGFATSARGIGLPAIFLVSLGGLNGEGARATAAEWLKANVPAERYPAEPTGDRDACVMGCGRLGDSVLTATGAGQRRRYRVCDRCARGLYVTPDAAGQVEFVRHATAPAPAPGELRCLVCETEHAALAVFNPDRSGAVAALCAKCHVKTGALASLFGPDITHWQARKVAELPPGWLDLPRRR